MANAKNADSEDFGDFNDAPPAPAAPRPAIRQLAHGADKVTRIYGAGTPDEQVMPVMGRLLIVVPTKYEKDLQTGFINRDTGKYKLQDRITADIHVLDGKPIDEIYNGRGDLKGTLDDPLVPVFVLKDQYISQKLFVAQLLPFVSEDGSKFAFGALGFLKAQGTNAPPYVLFGTTPEEKASAIEYWKNRPKEADPMA